MKAILIRANGDVEDCIISDETKLNSVQQLVGGFVQQIGSVDFIALMNENGKLENLPVNALASQIVHRYGFGLAPNDMLVGDIVFCSMDDGDWGGITAESRKRIQEAIILQPDDDEGPGPTGQFPFGKLNDDDKGELKVAIYLDKGMIRMDFGTPVTWLCLPPDQVLVFAEALIKKAKEARESG